MPAVFDRQGLRFLYPENWDLELGESPTDAGTVTVHSPTGAFWSITRYPRGQSPDALCQAVVAALREEYDTVEAIPIAARFAGDGAVSYELNFIYLDLIGTVRLHAFYTATATCLIYIQAEIRDYDALEQVFDAVCRSLRIGDN